ncbi:hypothetical protein ACFVRB_04615 [Streptomyces nojiriensis]|uniref:hypothetical protein n=1 Tax=Streptomyces nojiriensis TaxID=66374 RepID=UPI0036DC51CB
MLGAIMALSAAPGAGAADGKEAKTTDPALLAEARRHEPLVAIAEALSEQGKGEYADTFTKARIDGDRNRVVLLATDTNRAAKLIGAAKKAHGNINPANVITEKADFSKRVLDDKVREIMAASLMDPTTEPDIYSASPKSDGSGIEVGAKPDAVAKVKETFAAKATVRTAGAEIPVTTVSGMTPKAASWRWNDTRPQIGGDVLVGNARGGGTTHCTGGIAIETGGGRDYLVTAAHCFPAGTNVYGSGGSYGDLSQIYNSGGNYIGTVAGVLPEWDAEAIDSGLYNGAGFNSDTADQPFGTWYRVTNAQYSYEGGPRVCQDGARSYYTGHGVPCGTEVKDQDITYNLQWSDGSWHSIRGVLGYNSSWATMQGDSGGLVFGINSDGTRNARGIVSGVSADNKWIWWTEATDIMNNFNAKLNPHT